MRIPGLPVPVSIRARSILAALALLAVSMMASVPVACSTGGGAEGIPVADDARFTVIRPGEAPERVADLEAVLAVVPFEAALPASLPAGLQLWSAEARLADPRIDAAAEPFNTHLTLSFGGGDASSASTNATTGFAISQQGAGADRTTVVDPGVVRFEIDGTTAAQLAERTLDGVSFTSLWFRACALDMQLTTASPDVMPREEVVALARAFIGGCES